MPRKRAGREKRRSLLQPLLDRGTVERKEEGRSPRLVPGGTGFGMSAGRRFMWLLIESFSLDRAACFLPSRDSLRVLLLLLSFAALSLSLSGSFRTRAVCHRVLSFSKIGPALSSLIRVIESIENTYPLSVSFLFT